MIDVALECTNYMVLSGESFTPPNGMNRCTLALLDNGWALEICFENKKIPKVYRDQLYNYTAVYSALQEISNLYHHDKRINGPEIDKYMKQVTAYVEKYPVR